MGLTPLEGLVMGSRSGDVDPGLVTYLVRIGACSVGEGERVLTEESGLRGLSGVSGDMREVLAARATNTKAALAVDAFCYRARKYVGAYFAAIGGADALVFSGGIGEHSPDIRREVVHGLDCLGFRLDPARNDAAIGTAARISAAGSPRAVWVIPADEESVMASDVVACVRGRA
jgi:acetate kinase